MPGISREPCARAARRPLWLAPGWCSIRSLNARMWSELICAKSLSAFSKTKAGRLEKWVGIAPRHALLAVTCPQRCTWPRYRCASLRGSHLAQDFTGAEYRSTGILLTRVFEPLQGKQPVCWVVQGIQV